MAYTLRRALARDIKFIHGMLFAAAGKGLLLPRPLSDLYSHTRDFFVLEGAGGEVLGCGALSIVWEDVAEVRSVFVREELRGKGGGRLLVEAALEEARSLGIPKVFTLTYETGFFTRLGFAEVGKDSLPQKIWSDCIHCPKFPDCDEVAMQRLV
jgi:amino-acid N-acetyltransferase